MPLIDDILAQLPQLTPDELARVHQATGALQSITAPTASVTTIPDNFCAMTLDTIVAVLSKMGVEFSYPSQLQKSPAFPSFRDKLPGLEQFIRQAAGTNRNKQRAVLYMGVDLLYRDLVEMGTTTSSRLLLSHIHRVPSVINKHFPGYARAGMLMWIIRGGKDDNETRVATSTRKG